MSQSVSKKLRKIEENEAFIAAWQTKECLWNVLTQAYKDRKVKKEEIKNLLSKME